MQVFFALIAAKLLQALLRLFGRGGTSLPGRAALLICPDLLPRLSKDMALVLVTGTNGKTTTCRMAEKMLSDWGRPCAANRSGANLRYGIAAALADNASPRGRAKRPCAVIECDEAAFRTVCGELQPRAVVVTNLFRDQLDRFGEITHTLESLRAGLERSPKSVLIYNADCPLCSSLAELPNPSRSFGMDVDLGCAAEISDAPRCIKCGGRYEYSSRSFAHLGAFRCPKCGYARSAPAVSVAEISALEKSLSRAVLAVDGQRIPVTLSLPGSYNLYNAAAAVAAATALGLPAHAACRSLSDVESGFGRQESFKVGSVDVTVILIKNPAGCDRAADYVASLPGARLCLICLCDNAADGRDISWIWDANFEVLADAPGLSFAVSGTRAEEMRLRLKYAGAEESAVAMVGGTGEIMALIAASPVPVYILPTYTAMLPLRHALSAATGKKEFWK